MSQAITEGRREAHKRETRRALHDAALRLAMENGFHATTVADISAAAGVAPRTFFGYFASKEAALYGPLEDLIAILESRLSAPTPPDALYAFRAWVIEDVLASGELEPFALNEFREVASRADGVAAYGLQYKDRVATALANGIRRQLRSTPGDTLPEAAAAAVVTALTAGMPVGARVTEIDCVVPNAPDLVREVDRALAFARAGLSAVNS